MPKVTDDPQVKDAIKMLQEKAVTLDQIAQVYRHYHANLPAPGTQVRWKATNQIMTVRINRSSIFRVEIGYIQIRNNVGTDLFLLPHEYDLLPQATETTEPAQAE